MKNSPPFLLLAGLFLTACDKPAAPRPDHGPEAHFKTGHGVSLPEPMRKSLGIETTDVVEQTFAPRLEIPLHVLGAAEASGWISAQQAEGLKPGQAVKLTMPDGKSATGAVREIRKAAYSALGDYEIVVAADTTLPFGATATGILESAPTGEVVTVPADAILKTAEGEFVYVANEDYFARTPVKTGARNDQLVEIADGLFSGDQVVSKQVTPLWMTELQSLRAGQSCSHGH